MPSTLSAFGTYLKFHNPIPLVFPEFLYRAKRNDLSDVLRRRIHFHQQARYETDVRTAKRPPTPDVNEQSPAAHPAILPQLRFRSHVEQILSDQIFFADAPCKRQARKQVEY